MNNFSCLVVHGKVEGKKIKSLRNALYSNFPHLFFKDNIEKNFLLFSLLFLNLFLLSSFMVFKYKKTISRVFALFLALYNNQTNLNVCWFSIPFHPS